MQYKNQTRNVSVNQIAVREVHLELDVNDLIGMDLNLDEYDAVVVRLRFHDTARQDGSDVRDTRKTVKFYR